EMRACVRADRNPRNCTQITDVGLALLGPSIQYLDLSECTITDRTIIHVAEKCSDLRSLRLASCRVSDSAMEQLCRSCPRLSSLFLSSCDSITGGCMPGISMKLGSNLLCFVQIRLYT